MMKGEITREYTFWCGKEGCANWAQYPSANQREAVKEAKRASWRKTKVFGWICPECVSKEKGHGKRNGVD